jgi:hypothetical protein
MESLGALHRDNVAGLLICVYYVLFTIYDEMIVSSLCNFHKDYIQCWDPLSVLCLFCIVMRMLK